VFNADTGTSLGLGWVIAAFQSLSTPTFGAQTTAALFMTGNYVVNQ